MLRIASTNLISENENINVQVLPSDFTVFKKKKSTSCHGKRKFAKINFRTLKCQCQCGLVITN